MRLLRSPLVNLGGSSESPGMMTSNVQISRTRNTDHEALTSALGEVAGHSSRSGLWDVDPAKAWER